jgi:hypothetical protein
MIHICTRKAFTVRCESRCSQSVVEVWTGNTQVSRKPRAIQAQAVRGALDTGPSKGSEADLRCENLAHEWEYRARRNIDAFCSLMFLRMKNCLYEGHLILYGASSTTANTSTVRVQG